MNKSNVITSLVVSVVVSLLFWLGGHSSSPAPLGGRVETVLNEFGGGIKITGGGLTLNDASLGSSGLGSTYKYVKDGTCFLVMDATITASTTKNYDCAFTGVRSGDLVWAHFNASSTLASQYVIKGYAASTTNGYITFSVYNATGGSALPAATNGFGSSTVVQLWRRN